MVSWKQLTLDLMVSGELQLTIRGLTQLTTMHCYLFFKTPVKTLPCPELRLQVVIR